MIEEATVLLGALLAFVVLFAADEDIFFVQAECSIVLSLLVMRSSDPTLLSVIATEDEGLAPAIGLAILSLEKLGLLSAIVFDKPSTHQHYAS